ncbi:MAG TPA: hypothetical protein ENH91_15700 [Leeuwenhoekiella sp.]|nr:hypothetical protein [Leeuwenhoekiella sp.]
MKQSLLLIASVLLLISCTQAPESIYGDKIENYMKPKMKDSNSFELVNIEKIDTFYLSKDTQENFYNRYMRAQSENDPTKIAELKKEYSDRIESGKFSYVQVVARIRGNNSFGGKSLDKYSFYFDPQGYIESYDDDTINLLESQFSMDFDLDSYQRKYGKFD